MTVPSLYVRKRFKLISQTQVGNGKAGSSLGSQRKDGSAENENSLLLDWPVSMQSIDLL